MRRHNPDVGIVHDAGMHPGLRKDRGDRIWQAGEAVDAGDQDVGDASLV